MPVTNALKAVCAERLGEHALFFPKLGDIVLLTTCADEIAQGALTGSDVNDLDPLLR